MNETDAEFLKRVEGFQLIDCRYTIEHDLYEFHDTTEDSRRMASLAAECLTLRKRLEPIDAFWRKCEGWFPRVYSDPRDVTPRDHFHADCWNAIQASVEAAKEKP